MVKHYFKKQTLMKLSKLARELLEKFPLIQDFKSTSA